jgi:hypothetical protein
MQLCCERRRSVMCRVVNFTWCFKVVKTRYEIFGLCLQTSVLNSAPHKIKGQLSVKDNNVEVNYFSSSYKADLAGTCKHISSCLLYCSSM